MERGKSWAPWFKTKPDPQSKRLIILSYPEQLSETSFTRLKGEMQSLKDHGLTPVFFEGGLTYEIVDQPQ